MAVIDLARIRENARLLVAHTKKPLIAVVKDDAYGHGAVQVAHALTGVASAFAVATVEEGVALRVAGISSEILVLTPPIAMDDAARMAAYRLTATISSYRTLALIEAAECSAHLAVNTGMNRYGVRPDRVISVLNRAKAGGIMLTGAFSHLYLPADDTTRMRQESLFFEAAAAVKARYPEAVCHLDATGGSLYAKFDAIRIGLALYGYPKDFALPVKPAMRVYAYVAEARRAFEDGAGYCRADKKYRDVHTLRLGYGDGFFRTHGLGIGDLCMDACVVGGKEKAGRKKCVLKDAQEYAEACGTSVYEILVKIGKGTVKRYIY